MNNEFRAGVLLPRRAGKPKRAVPGRRVIGEVLSKLPGELSAVERHIREGRFQRSLSLVTALSSILAGTEVAYEHYKGSYSRRVMYTPVVLSAVLAGAGFAGTFSPWAARRLLRPVAAITLADGVAGFLFHVQGIYKKPGGWRLPVTNMIMGPPIFAPLLFGVAAYLGLIASYLRPETAAPLTRFIGGEGKARWLNLGGTQGWSAELRQGRFQQHLAVACLFGTFFSGFEALYSHYKSNFKYKSQWSPIVLTPLLMLAVGASLHSPKAARTWLPALSLAAIADGSVGFFFHVRGVLRRPGGLKKPFYNLLHGPPIFAPLLFAACGTVGLLASLMRRED